MDTLSYLIHDMGILALSNPLPQSKYYTKPLALCKEKAEQSIRVPRVEMTWVFGVWLAVKNWNFRVF